MKFFFPAYYQYELVQAATTIFRRMGNNRNVFSYNSGSWAPKIRVLADSGTGEGYFLTDGCLLKVTAHGKKSKPAAGVLFLIRAFIPFSGLSPSDFIISLRPHLLTPSRGGGSGLQHTNFEGGDTMFRSQHVAN